ncbi:hypothetical protein BH09PSE6_BH09PSE6_11420 [soil metagenome]
MRVAVLASGEGTTLQSLLDARCAGDLTAQIALVISNNRDSGALRRAKAAQVEWRHLSGATHPGDSDLDSAILEALLAERIDLIVLTGYLKKIGPQVLARFKGAIINTHPSLLPRHGGHGMYGKHVHAAVLASGDTESGASIHLVDAEYDTGAVIAQARLDARAERIDRLADDARPGFGEDAALCDAERLAESAHPDTMKSALLVIDVQQALCEGEYAAFDIDGVIDRINALTAKARAAGTPVIFIQHEESGGGPLTFGTEGWQLADGLVTDPADHKVRKTTCDSFLRTDLGPLLERLSISRLVVTGLQSEYCVDSSVRGALAHGYPVTLVADGHSTVDTDVLSAAQITAHHNQTLEHLGSFGPRVTITKAAEVSL